MTEIRAGMVLRNSAGNQIKIKRQYQGKVYAVRRKSNRGRWTKDAEIVDLTGFEPV